ncbi:FAD-dependent oxidoreductase [Streptomyces sp. NPDC059071]|uniref:FAD-dependent oxidoreductase n=1 Tax=unclassified Streptomyces TaxID=2593676 RepID=UPI0036692D56
MPHSTADLAVVGAGPAGLAAAVTAADLGLTVTLLDAGARPGGQYYRHPAPGLGAARPQALHHDWQPFAALTRRLETHRRRGRVAYLPNHHVWTVTPTGGAGPWSVHARTDGAAEPPAPVTARAVLLATGSYERQLPFPGWTLPGVIGAGGAQAMLKGGLVLPGRRIVVAGSGPLLLAVAASLSAAGARVPAVAEASGYGGYAAHAATILRNPAKLVEGARYGSALVRHHTRLLTRHAVVEAHGTDRVEAVTIARLDRDWRPVPGTARRIPCDAVAVGHGLVPELSLATALGCATRTAADGTVALALTDDLRTSVPGVWSAGETGGIGGAQLALVEGALAAHSIARVAHATDTAYSTDAAYTTDTVHAADTVHVTDAADAARVVRPVAAAPAAPAALRRARARLRAFADAMASAHRPGAGWTDWLADAADVCRCEEVTAGEVREAVTELGARDARTVKLLTRAGMGWCQGRMCGPAVAALCGAVTAEGAAMPPAPDRRPLACPVPLRQLASLPDDLN